jgi:hypothetical protein
MNWNAANAKRITSSVVCHIDYETPPAAPEFHGRRVAYPAGADGFAAGPAGSALTLVD